MKKIFKLCLLLGVIAASLLLSGCRYSPIELLFEDSSEMPELDGYSEDYSIQYYGSGMNRTYSLLNINVRGLNKKTLTVPEVVTNNKGESFTVEGMNVDIFKYAYNLETLIWDTPHLAPRNYLCGEGVYIKNLVITDKVELSQLLDLQEGADSVTFMKDCNVENLYFDSPALLEKIMKSNYPGVAKFNLHCMSDDGSYKLYSEGYPEARDTTLQTAGKAARLMELLLALLMIALLARAFLKNLFNKELRRERDYIYVKKLNNYAKAILLLLLYVASRVVLKRLGYENSLCFFGLNFLPVYACFVLNSINSVFYLERPSAFGFYCFLTVFVAAMPTFHYCATVNGEMLPATVISAVIYYLLSSAMAHADSWYGFIILVIIFCALAPLPFLIDVGLKWIHYIIAFSAGLGILALIGLLAGGGYATKKVIVMIYEE